MARVKTSSKASITVSFSWVFMIIVGTLFIVLAYNVVSKYQEIEQQKYDFELRGVLRQAFSEIGQDEGISTSSLTPLEGVFANREVEIICEGGFSILSIDGNLDANNDYLQNFPAFMTFIDEGKISSTYLAVESFKMPFKITNAMGIVSTKNLIVFDENSETAVKLARKFERGSYDSLNYVVRNFGTELAGIGTEIDGKGITSVVFVTDSGSEGEVVDAQGIPERSYVVAFEDTPKGKGSYGFIEFFNVEDLSSSPPSQSLDKYGYVDFDGSLSIQTMAVFSSPEVFDCSYDLMLSHIENVYSYYELKAQNFADSSDNLCNLDSAEQKIRYSDLKTSLEKAKSSINTGLRENPDDVFTSISKVSSDMSNLENFDCVYVY
ncbi:MAG: hypothetical protein ACOCXG_00300 [Nanoarchaeota archaeon]